MTNQAWSSVRSTALVESFQQSKQKLYEQEAKQRKVLSALYQINSKMKKLIADRGNIQRERSVLEDSTTKLSLRIAELDQKSIIQRSALSSRLRAIYRLGGQSLARLVFSAQSSSALDRELRIMGSLAKRDKQLVAEYLLTKKEVLKKRDRLANRLLKMKSLGEKLASREAALSEEQSQKEKLLMGIKRSQIFAKNELQTLRIQSQYAVNVEDSGVLDILFQQSFADRKGQLPSPIEAKVVSTFGIQKDPIYQYSYTQKGIQYQSTRQEKIKSVFQGKIAFSGILPGLGKTVIIDHGDHYFTVYGNLSEPAIVIGSAVKENQIIGTSDQLYFEVRHFSEPYDPMLWMKGKTTL